MDRQRRIVLLGLASLAAPAPAVQADYPFSLGVASGSPLPDSVILWTRIPAAGPMARNPRSG